MNAKPSRLGVIAAILRKDIYLMSRDVVFVFLTLLAVATFVILYWVLPDNVDETISMGIRGEGVKTALNALAGESEEAMNIAWYDDTEALANAVEDRDVEIGIDFPDGFAADVASGKEVTVTVYARPNLPSEFTFAMSSMVREMAYALAGFQLPVTEPNEEMVILGADSAGQQRPVRDQMRPLYAFMVLVMEAIALGSLIASEIQNKTVVALVVTPARLSDILGAKWIVGTLVAFSEAILIMLLIRGLGPSPGIVIAALALGAILVTGVAMIAGSAGKDLVGTMLLGIVFLIPLAIPAFSVLFPGTPAPWVRALPTYGLVRVIVDSSFHGAGWAESARHLAVLGAWCIVFDVAGVVVLGRRVATL